MPRKAKNVPGTERYRDERRTGGGPRMHGRSWHDREQPDELEGELERSARKEAVLEVESSGDRTGMHARSVGTRASTTHARRKRTVPPGKGLKHAVGERTKSSTVRGTRVKASAKRSRRISTR